VIIDIENNSLIISDRDNRRVMRWFLENGTKNGEFIIEDIDCSRLAMDKNGYLYVSDYKKYEVRRWSRGNQNGTIVLSCPEGLAFDREGNLYVVDSKNHRIQKFEIN
jgi:sugar lactone lactonase YvrE